MRLDGVGEKCENINAKVINMAGQARGGQRETTVPMELDNVSGGEMYDEDWEDVNEVRGDKNGLQLRDNGTHCEKLQDERQGQRERKRRRQGLYQRLKSEMVRGAGKKGSGKSGGFKGGRGEQNDRGYQGQC